MIDNDANELTATLKDFVSDKENFIFACIGTDRSTGDCLGPLIGTQLEKMGYNVIGTLSDPLHAVNLSERLENIPDDTTVIAIDACLGNTSSVGKIFIKEGSIKPGSGVGKVLPEVGDFAITGIVNVSGFMEYFVLQNTRLNLVMNMADMIVEVVKSAIPIEVPEPVVQETVTERKKMWNVLKRVYLKVATQP